MNRILSFFVAGLMACTLAACSNQEGKASMCANEEPSPREGGLTLSDMRVKITSMGRTATFRLYDTVAGIDEIAGMSGSALIDKNEPNASRSQTAMKISMHANGKTTVFELNDSPAARDLYVQLPLSITVENYSNNEKIFYPPKKLNTADTPQADAQVGTLAYYAPWGDVVMFYGRFGSATGLYELGQAVSGSEYIQGMAGTIRIEKGDVRYGAIVSGGL